MTTSVFLTSLERNTGGLITSVAVTPTYTGQFTTLHGLASLAVSVGTHIHKCLAN